MRTALVATLLALCVICFGCSEAARVVDEEVGPAALRDKYEWFKRASAALDKKQADMDVYASRITGMEEDYADTPRSGWAREDREQFNIWRSELAGVKASYNTLAASYNAEMAMFYTRFLNAGMLPQGAKDAPPREYRMYDYGTE
jgi:hypothetical protein